ncbi:unnamed protein product [Lactuca virosa]|uniref:Uncharacterized protein n=1 Tax=Lactuca virosa TaxID=75947 RepID=A0AAU9N377_9ASTR|nr:unnamed protein product [Lactuca virosa]
MFPEKPAMEGMSLKQGTNCRAVSVSVVLHSDGRYISDEKFNNFFNLQDGVAFILQSALLSNLCFISQLLHRKYSGNFLVDLLGKWKESYSGQSVPFGGIAYYVTAPSSLADMAANAFHTLFYLVFMLTACALFSKTK